MKDLESDNVKYKIPNERLSSTPQIKSSVAKEPIKFSEICSRSSNQ